MGILISGNQNKADNEGFAPTSSFIATVDYDSANRSMDVMFKSGTKIRYLNVFPSTFLSFKQSPTHSAFYARAIKGNLLSAKIIDAGIGPNQAGPLKKVTRSEPLDRGLKKQQSRERAIWGTIARAQNAATISS